MQSLINACRKFFRFFVPRSRPRTVLDAYNQLGLADEVMHFTEWETLHEVVCNLNPRVLGFDFAKWIIWYAVCAYQYPNDETRRMTVGRAEAIASELFEEYGNHANAEPHMSEIEWIGKQKGFSPSGFVSV